jgi:uncharacterized protein
MTLRRLTQADYPAFERFLSGRAATSMFLRSNARRAGLDFKGQALQARYFGASGADGLEGVMALCWNGNLMVEAPDPVVLEALRAFAAEAEPDFIAQGVLGAGDQAERMLDWLQPAPESLRLCEREPLLCLELAGLRTPAPLQEGVLASRRAGLEDLEVLIAWGTAYNVETLGGAWAEMNADPEGAVRHWIERDAPFLLMAEGTAVAMAAFNAVLPDIVQIGGVYTPPELRDRGYARAVVAAALIEARDKGVVSANLFTHSPAAERAYRALGFERVGDYHIALFDPGVRLGGPAT